MKRAVMLDLPHLNVILIAKSNLNHTPNELGFCDWD